MLPRLYSVGWSGTAVLRLPTPPARRLGRIGLIRPSGPIHPTRRITRDPEKEFLSPFDNTQPAPADERAGIIPVNRTTPLETNFEECRMHDAHEPPPPAVKHTGPFAWYQNSPLYLRI